jgi:hypothetical protein
MLRAVNAVVHDSVMPQAAYDQYLTAMRGPDRPEAEK